MFSDVSLCFRMFSMLVAWFSPLPPRAEDASASADASVSDSAGETAQSYRDFLWELEKGPGGCWGNFGVAGEVL